MKPRGNRGFFAWAKERSSPRDLMPMGIGAWLLKEGIEGGNEMFVFISLYLFGLIPAWWADGGDPTQPPGLPAPAEAVVTPSQEGGGPA